MTTTSAMGTMTRMLRPAGRLVVRAFVVAVILGAGGGRAFAEPSPDDKALATTLFQEGRALMAAGRIPEACLKLEESERLDPGGGTILNLALCHEQEGRLARSWSEFNEAVVRARKDGRRDREVEAVEHARALKPRLSTLTVSVPIGAQIPGLQIEHDGRELGRGAWSTAIPVDGGEHVLRASAPGRHEFKTTVVIGKEGDAQTVEIPVLATPVVVVTPPKFTATADTSEGEPGGTTDSTHARRLRWAGIGVAVGGVATLGAAGLFLVSALGKRSDSRADCTGDLCGTSGLQARADAVSRGNWATALGIGGAVLLGGGATLYYFGRRSGAATRDTRAAASFTIGAAPGAFVAGVEGTL